MTFLEVVLKVSRYHCAWFYASDENWYKHSHEIIKCGLDFIQSQDAKKNHLRYMIELLN